MNVGLETTFCEVAICGLVNPFMCTLDFCECLSSNEVRFCGALGLALQVQSLDFDAIEFNPYDTFSARQFARRALDMRLQNDAVLAGRDIEELRRSATEQRNPHSLFAESVLRLVKDVDDDTRGLGLIAWSRLPEDVQRQTVWSPSLHILLSS